MLYRYGFPCQNAVLVFNRYCTGMGFHISMQFWCLVVMRPSGFLLGPLLVGMWTLRSTESSSPGGTSCVSTFLERSLTALDSLQCCDRFQMADRPHCKHGESVLPLGVSQWKLYCGWHPRQQKLCCRYWCHDDCFAFGWQSLNETGRKLFNEQRKQSVLPF